MRGRPYNLYLVVSAASKIRRINILVKTMESLGFNVYVIPTVAARQVLEKLEGSLDFNLVPEKELSKSSFVQNNSMSLPEANIVMVAPATFNTISKMVNGITDNYAMSLLSSAISLKLPVIVAPSYDDMWHHPLNMAYLSKLSSWGVRVVWPDLEKDHITMAPSSKIGDTARSIVYKVKFKSKKLDYSAIDMIYNTAIERFYKRFKKNGIKTELFGINSGVNGCMGVRIDDKHILVTASGSKVSELRPGSLSLVEIQKSHEEKIIYWYGSELPSSETPLYLSIFKLFPDVNAIVHTHNPDITYSKAHSVYRTKEYIPYGEFDVNEELSDILKFHRFGILRMHGEIAVGENIESVLMTIRKHTSSVKENIN